MLSVMWVKVWAREGKSRIVNQTSSTEQYSWLMLVVTLCALGIQQDISLVRKLGCIEQGSFIFLFFNVLSISLQIAPLIFLFFFIPFRLDSVQDHKKERRILTKECCHSYFTSSQNKIRFSKNEPKNRGERRRNYHPLSCADPSLAASYSAREKSFIRGSEGPAANLREAAK